MNNKRRGNRGNTARSKSPEQKYQGVYTNQHFTTTATGLVGCIAQVDTTDGSCYSGVYSSFSSQFEVVLELAQQLNDGPEINNKNPHQRRMIISVKNIISMSFKDIDPTFATRDSGFQTDANISKYDRNGQTSGEKELQPWVSDCNGDEVDLTLGSDSGWDANAMFKLNEEMYGVKSNFDHSLAGYTTTIERSDSKGFKDAEARAAKIAHEIERNTKSQAQADLENGDEEERFAAVVRPDDSNSPPREKTGKYIPPVRRLGGSYQGRLAPRSQPFPPGHPGHAPSPSSSTEEPQERRPEVETSPQVPTPVSDDNRNNNSESPSAVPVNPSLPPPTHPRSNHSTNNNNPSSNGNNARGKPYNVIQSVQPVPYQQYTPPPPRYPAHPTIVQQRPMPPATQHPPPSAIQHHPPPPVVQQQQPMPTAVYAQQLPPNHAHPSAIPVPGMPQDVVAQPMPVQLQQVPHQPPTQMNIVHGVDGSGMVHMPPHGVQHGHPVYMQPAPREHDQEYRGHRNAGIRGQSPRGGFQANKRFPTPHYQNQVPRPGKPRQEEVNELVEFSTNLKLAPSEPEPETEEKQDSPPMEWNKGRSPPSNSSAEEAANMLKKSTLNPNAKEFVFNPGAKSFTPRPPNTPLPSRPQTPQTPAQPYGYSPGPMPAVIMPTTYVMQQTFSHQTTPPRIQMAPRPDISSSQMQVAAATGQPLQLTAPMTRFVAPYPNPPPQQYQQMVRMVPGQGPVVFHEGQPHAVQYMSPHAHQPHSAGQFQHAQPQQFPVLYSAVPLNATMMQYIQQQPQPGQQSHVQVIMPNQ